MSEQWRSTLNVLQPLISNPPLTEKLLSRPPFRFIHDIISSIAETHGVFGEDVFPPELRDSSLIDCKEKKIDYLSRLKEKTEKIIGRTINVNVRKIVAGLETDKTNVFLQCVAEAVNRCSVRFQGGDKTAAKVAVASPIAQSSSPVSSPKHGDVSGVIAESASPVRKPEKVKLSASKAKKSVPSCSTVGAQNSHEEFASTAAAINKKAKMYGVDSPGDDSCRDIALSVIEMEKSLRVENNESETGEMKVEQLEVAIKRQIEIVKQLKDLTENNLKLCNDCVDTLVKI